MLLSAYKVEQLKGDFQKRGAKANKFTFLLLKESSANLEKSNYPPLPDSTGYFELGKFNRDEEKMYQAGGFY